MLTFFLIAAACWIAAGPGGVTVQALIACHHHHASHAPHAPPAPQAPHTPQSHDGDPDGPCFCDEMMGGWTVALSPALPAPVVAPPSVPTSTRVRPYQSPFLPPPSLLLAPESPPPNGLV
jgi:hypothetical protein